MNLFVKAWLVGYLRPTSNLLKVRAACQRWQALVLAEGRGGLALEGWHLQFNAKSNTTRDERSMQRCELGTSAMRIFTSEKNVSRGG